MELEALSEVIDRLFENDAACHSDGASMVALYRELSRLQCYVTEATGSFETAQGYVADGARDAASWLASRCDMARRDAKRTLGTARALRELPSCERAWSTGELSGAKVGLIASCARDSTRAALVRDEEMLLHHARSLSYAQFSHLCRYWSQCADPDRAERDAEAIRARRDVSLTKSFAGTYLGTITLDPISGEIVTDELSRLEKELFDKDWKAAKESLGREPRLADLARSPAMRRADALVEMAIRSRTAPHDGRRPVPLLTVLVGYETLAGRICELASGTIVTPGSLLSFLDEAEVERAVFGPNGRVEVSERQRLFSGATRRAIELRDRQCTHPCCDAPMTRCQVDHIVPFSLGGRTTQDNGRLLCGYHNRLRNTRPPPEG